MVINNSVKSVKKTYIATGHTDGRVGFWILLKGPSDTKYEMKEILSRTRVCDSAITCLYFNQDEDLMERVFVGN